MNLTSVARYCILLTISSLLICCRPENAQQLNVNPLKYKKIKMKNLLGINAFEWDFLQDPHNPNDGSKIYEPKMDMMKSFTAVRHYMDWEKLEDKPGIYSFNPTTRGGWNYDAIYARCKMEGITVLACLKNTPDWLFNTYPAGQRDVDDIPVKGGVGKENPDSYVEQAKAIFQFAARYGSNKNIDTSLITLNHTPRWSGDVVNQTKVGLNLIKYVECNNEPDKWWKGKKAQQTGREYAANLSAFYDGNKGKMGKNVGVKTADPNMKVVMGGLAKADVKFVREMVEWCKENRGYKPDGSIDLCFDVINYHLYSNDNTGWFAKFKSNKRGVAPETNTMGEIADSFVALAGELGKNMEVWTTETGYDLKEESIQGAIPIGAKSVLLTQADWILRTSLMYARHGINRVFFYQAYDSDAPGSDSKNPFGTSGLLNEGKRRPAADYLLQVNKLMGEYVYDNTIYQDPLVDIYKLNDKTMYVLVIPDEHDRKGEYTLDLHQAKKARIYTLKPGADSMTAKDYNTQNGKLKVAVTETPTFVEAL
ncbi:hypothetical protein [Pedobacter cryoconitis]|uniref:Glycoside hydrolase family 42 N-terminal domain-containing protein n=1 Tax=Pedobacter cryoconitis TaxID=188932 RepID=A0A7X0IZ46_9SPHI|nr:hypothetical protein [Pedobacter cryoconitis]MBB6498119.1 hypothetical protein [Pedobacter cryoconitis]